MLYSPRNFSYSLTLYKSIRVQTSHEYDNINLVLNDVPSFLNMKSHDLHGFCWTNFRKRKDYIKESSYRNFSQTTIHTRRICDVVEAKLAQKRWDAFCNNTEDPGVRYGLLHFGNTIRTYYFLISDSWEFDYHIELYSSLDIVSVNQESNYWIAVDLSFSTFPLNITLRILPVISTKDDSSEPTIFCSLKVSKNFSFFSFSPFKVLVLLYYSSDITTTANINDFKYYMKTYSAFCYITSQIKWIII